MPRRKRTTPAQAASKRKTARLSAPRRESGRKGTPARPEETPRGKEDGLIIVGVGASAGGLEALRTMFGGMPPD